ncbi:MAG: Holliday junction resolvase RuvX [candidate division Zixibacteria bacterium]|nr:Holliday junction resolvase RuvX [candidate division Zixibacteria bacterium]
MSRVLAVDRGDARVGLAISDESRTLASGYGFVRFKGYNDLIENLLSIAEKESVDEFVIGLPLNMNGSSGLQATKSVKLADMLKDKTKYPVNLVDERLTTVEAARQIHASGKKVRKGRIDEVAATIILQAFLDGKKNR